MNDVKKSLIVGAGVNGLCIAFALQRAAWSVSIFDKVAPSEKNTPSQISPQIIRTQYPDFAGYALHTQSAFHAWQEIFATLGGRYYTPRGAIPISRANGDWGDRAKENMRSNHKAFGLVNPEQVEMMLPALNLDDVRFGVLTTEGGFIDAHSLLEDMRKYLSQMGVKFYYETEIADVSRDAITTKVGARHHADKVIVTGGQSALFSSFLKKPLQYQAYYMDCALDPAQEMLWRYAPIWIDLGKDNSHLWGGYIPNLHLLRLSSAALTHETKNPISQEQVFTKIREIYGNLIKGFGNYKPKTLHCAIYQGYKSGAFELSEIEGVISLIGDNGHGFKFAARNADLLVKAIESERMCFAAREIAGLV